MSFDAAKGESTQPSGPKPAPSLRTAGSGGWLRRLLRRERSRLRHALLLSLLIHGLLLSLTFDDQGLGIPGFAVPWRDRRIEVPDLRVVLVPAQAASSEPEASSASAPSRQALIVQPFSEVPAVQPSVAPVPILGAQSVASVGKIKPEVKEDTSTPAVTRSKEAAMSARATPDPPKSDTKVAPRLVSGEVPASDSPRTEWHDDSTAPVSERAVIALSQPDEATFVVPLSRSVPTPATEPAKSASSPDALKPAARGSGNEAMAAGEALLERVDGAAQERTIELARLERAERESKRRAEQLAQQEAADAARRLRRDEDSAQQEAERQEAERLRIAQQELARHDAAQLKAAQQEAVRQEASKLEAARVETERLEAARWEASRLEEARLEAARQEAAKTEAARLESARLEAARLEATRQEAARIEAARLEAARLEAARLDAARLEATRQEAARLEAARLEAARLEAARLEAARLDAARLEATRLEAERQVAARRQVEEVARRQTTSPAGASAMGDQGSRSAQQDRGADGSRAATTGREPSGGGASVQAAPAPVVTGQGLPSKAPVAGTHPEPQPAARIPVMQAATSSGLRRRTLIGRTDPDSVLVMYAENWRRKIELNTTSETIDLLREAKKQPRADPLVTVALRSNGTVEAVTFNRSSGVAKIDEAVRRTVQNLAPYQAFPPDLAREYDVIEIRRVWTFDTAIRLY